MEYKIYETLKDLCDQEFPLKEFSTESISDMSAVFIAMKNNYEARIKELEEQINIMKNCYNCLCCTPVTEINGYKVTGAYSGCRNKKLCCRQFVSNIEFDDLWELKQ